VDAASVDFYWDGSLVAHDTSAPFTATASLQEGHTFTVTANWANGSLSYDYTSQWGGQHLPMLRSGLYTNCMSFAGKAYCWGSGAYGAIGDGNGTVDRSTPYAISELAVNTTSIAMLADGACATHSGSAYCWGKNDNGVVGLNPATDPSTAWPNPIVLVGTYVEVGAGDDFACFRTSGGALDCIGSGSVGQMGNGGTTATNYAMVSTYASGVKRVAAGGDTACVITSSDRVECWGRDGRGQAGNGGTAATYIASPADVGLSSVVDIAVGYRHACALNSSGTVYCWGDNSCGQIGIGSSDASVHVSPVSATSLTALGVSRLFSGRNYNTCVVTSAGAMKCVGENTLGELGTGATSSCEVMPVTVSGFTSGVVGGAIGGADGAAFRNGHVYYFGDNTYTEIGNASASNPQLTPIQVTGF
jgi:alpha-tubulin suppressor-like RCC1 family protein